MGLAYGPAGEETAGAGSYIPTMRDVLRNLARVIAVAAFVVPAIAFDGPTQKGSPKKAAAQKADGGADQEKSQAAALVQQAFDAGIKAYGAGKFEEAQRAFEAAVRGGLPASQMPRLLYYRGLTFRKLGKPGFAISDLTSALWLKGSLSEAERADAVKARALAYNEAGISDVPPVPQSAYASPPAMPGKGASSSTQTAMAGGDGGTSATISSAPAAPTPQSSSGGGIGGFFSSLFGGGSSSSEPAPSAPPVAAPAQAASGWGAATEVIPNASAKRAPEIAAPFVTQVASVDDSANVPRRGAAPSGKYRLQVAAVRTRSEAEALAGLLVGRHGDQLGGRQPEVDESVIGSMGTFYRVRLGPYASAGEPERLCTALQADGFDCLLVTQ